MKVNNVQKISAIILGNILICTLFAIAYNTSPPSSYDLLISSQIIAIISLGVLVWSDVIQEYFGSKIQKYRNVKKDQN